MSGNNMSRMSSQSQKYIEDFYEEEVYENVYEYMEECSLKKIISHLDRSRELAVDMSLYPDRFGNLEGKIVEEPMHVYIRSEKLSFISNKKHVHFDQFGYPY